MSCKKESENLSHCNCTYPGCDKKGNCCACLKYHLSMKQLPACAFPNDVEKTYDRSFRKFADIYKSK